MKEEKEVIIDFLGIKKVKIDEDLLAWWNNQDANKEEALWNEAIKIKDKLHGN